MAIDVYLLFLVLIILLVALTYEVANLIISLPTNVCKIILDDCRYYFPLRAIIGWVVTINVYYVQDRSTAK